MGDRQLFPDFLGTFEEKPCRKSVLLQEKESALYDVGPETQGVQRGLEIKGIGNFRQIFSILSSSNTVENQSCYRREHLDRTFDVGP